MIKNPANATSYAEMFDEPRLRKIAELALVDKAPNGTFSDLECNVWGLFREVIRKAGKEA